MTEIERQRRGDADNGVRTQRAPIGTPRCAYWIGSDATGRRCESASDRAGYCAKHYPIVLRRTEKSLAKREAARRRDDAAWFARNVGRLPAWRTQLEQAEAEYARRTASPARDRAAVGGDMHGSIVRAQARHLSDTNVARVLELERIIGRLRGDIARAQGDDAR